MLQWSNASCTLFPTYKSHSNPCNHPFPWLLSVTYESNKDDDKFTRKIIFFNKNPFSHIHKTSCMINHGNQCLNTNLYTTTHEAFHHFHYLPLDSFSSPFLWLFLSPFSSLLVKSPQENHKKILTSVSILASIHKIILDLTFLLLTAQRRWRTVERSPWSSLSLSLGRTKQQMPKNAFLSLFIPLYIKQMA